MYGKMHRGFNPYEHVNVHVNKGCGCKSKTGSANYGSNCGKCCKPVSYCDKPQDGDVNINVSQRHYHGRPVHINHASQQCCYSKPNAMHHHQNHCSCNMSYQSCGCNDHHNACCKPNEKMVAVIPSGTENALALFAGLECGTYTIIRSENEENSTLLVNGVAQESTVGTDIVIAPNTQGSVVISFEEGTSTESAGYMEIVKTGECTNG